MSKDYTPYQQKIIARYYDNRDQIDDQRLAELVTNLYLAKTEKQRIKHWETAREIMERLQVPAGRIAHVMDKKDPAILAEVVKDLQTGKIKRP